MKKTIIKFGLVGGVLMIGLVFLIATLCEREIVTLDRAELFGYAGMLIALTMVFFGIRQYRQEHGSITFWKGCQIGLGISAIAAVMYFIGGEIYNLINPEFGPAFMAKYAEYQVELMKAKGAAEPEIEAMRQQMNTFLEMYKNPLVRFGVALIEFLPVGIIVTLVCSLLLRRTSPEAQAS